MDWAQRRQQRQLEQLMAAAERSGATKVQHDVFGTRVGAIASLSRHQHRHRGCPAWPRVASRSEDRRYSRPQPSQFT